MKLFTKDPNAKLDYTIDWGPWLKGDTISASEWSVSSGLDVVETPSPFFSSSTATIWLEGGSLEGRYEVRNRITTVAGRIQDETFIVRIANK